jgi:hypothetical protein
MIVFFALMIAVGVIFGTGAVVVDGGYGMGQQTLMQTTADASALGAGKLMASSVALDPNNNAIYALRDYDIGQRATALAIGNFQNSGLPGTNRAIAIQYLHCDGTPADTYSFSHSSDLTLVTQLVGSDKRITGGFDTSAPPKPTGNWSTSPLYSWVTPQPQVCMLRVYAQNTHPPIFALGLSGPGQEIAQATVRIAGTDAPTTFTGVWPITHQLTVNPDGSVNNLDCDFTTNTNNLCQFWGNTGGNFKQLVDMSQNSAINGREQLFEPDLSATQLTDKCTTATNCYDTGHPGTNDWNADLVPWTLNGWKGQLYIPNENDPKCTNSTRVVAECPNTRLEVFGGNHGGNIAKSIYDKTTDTGYLKTFNENPDPNDTHYYATIPIFFWTYGETSINSSTNRGTVAVGDPGQRIILRLVRNFRFTTDTLAGSNIQGYYVGFYNPSGNWNPSNPPSNIANTVKLVG